jgi:hypothetical protein
VQVAVMTTLRPLGGGEDIRQAQVFPIGDNIYRPILEAYREGDDARDVLSDAIDWWEAELQAIEKALAAQKGAPDKARRDSGKPRR